MPQYSQTGNDILTIFVGHQYYRRYRYYRPELAMPTEEIDTSLE